MNRSYRDLHRDFWRLWSLNPAVFFVLPVLAFLPIDLVVAFVTQDMGFGDAIKTAARVQQIASLVIGTYVASVIVWTVRAMTEGQRPDFGASLRGGKHYWGAVSITSFQSGFRVGLGLLALIVPGIILAVRYAFALPVTVFEDIHGRPAILRSKEAVRGSAKKVFGMFFLSVLIFLPLVLLLAGLPSTLSEEPVMMGILEAIGNIPISAAIGCMTLGTAVAYLEICHPEKLQAALATSQPKVAGVANPGPAYGGGNAAPGLPWPWFIGLGSWGGTMALFFAYIGIGMIPVLIGGHYSEGLNYAKAREYFDVAVRLEPESFDVRFGVGTHLLNSREAGDEERALSELQKAAQLRPDYGDAHLFLAAAYLANGDFEQGKAALSRAEQLGVESVDYLETLKSHVAAAEQPETGIESDPEEE